MGKSFELLGLAAFQVFLALVLSVAFLTNAKSEGLGRLTEAHVTEFINEVSDITVGKRADMDHFSITTYFMTHIAEDGEFITRVQYEIPQIPSHEQTLEMGKLDFISHILQDLQMRDEREAFVNIEHIEIVDNGTRAQVVTTNKEQGMLPVDIGTGEPHMIPVVGTSFCEQELILRDKNIQMVKNNCTTAINANNDF